MYLIHPPLLNDGTTVKPSHLAMLAQKMCKDFAHRLGVHPPKLVITDEMVERAVCINVRGCKSPVGKFARLTPEGNIVLAADRFSKLLLKFAIAHQLAHLVLGDVTEWQCDLAALDLLNCPEVPIVEHAALLIAQAPHRREVAYRFQSGQRVVAIGDALWSHPWEDSFVLQLSDRWHLVVCQ